MLSKVESDPLFHTMTIHNINETLHDSDELVRSYHIRKTNEKIDGPNASKYKIISQLPINHNEKITIDYHRRGNKLYYY